MDIIEFHQLMRDKHAETECRHRRLLRIWILCNTALVASLLSFVFTYLRFAGK
jgi:hypothetical protein